MEDSVQFCGTYYATGRVTASLGPSTCIGFAQMVLTFRNQLYSEAYR